jgi:hypothetical protein
LDENPTTETRAAAGTARPETVKEPGVPEKVSQLRQKLGQKAKQKPKFGPSVGACACLRREFSGEPDAGNPHLRFDEGRVGRAICVALSPTLPAQLGLRQGLMERSETAGRGAVSE